MSLADGTGPDRRDFAQAHATRAAGDQPLAPTNSHNGNGSSRNKASDWQGFAKRADSTARWGKRSMSHGKALDCFDRCVAVLSARERNSLRRRARLLRARGALGLKQEITPQEIAQRVLEAKDAQAGHSFEALDAADRAAMPRPVVRWLIPGLLPAGDMTIVGGRAKVGKTRLAVAMAQAILDPQPFLGFGKPPQPRTVILVTDDQADGDTADMLHALGLWDHPRLLWSRHFRLTEKNMDALLATLKANPGAAVILDSLRSISRSLQHGENDPEIGATLYDLKAAVLEADGTLLLIHHCNKADGLVGTEALSGHNSIAGAANTILTLHYVMKDGKPSKAVPERRLVREARSGNPFDLVITRSGDGKGFDLVGPHDDWQQQAEQDQAGQRLTGDQQEALGLLVAEPERWWTVRDASDALGKEWQGSRCALAQKLKRAFDRLAEIGKADPARAGAEMTWRFIPPPEPVMKVMKLMKSPQGSASACITPNDEGDEGDVVHQWTNPHGQGPNRIGGELIKKSLNLKKTLRGDVPVDGGGTPDAADFINFIKPGDEGKSQPTTGLHQLHQLHQPLGGGYRVTTPDVGGGADAFADDDDPAWGPRPERPSSGT